MHSIPPFIHTCIHRRRHPSSIHPPSITHPSSPSSCNIHHGVFFGIVFWMISLHWFRSHSHHVTLLVWLRSPQGHQIIVGKTQRRHEMLKRSSSSKVEARRSKLEARRTKLEGRSSKAEGRSSTFEARRTKLEARRSKLEGRRTTLEARRPNVEARRSKN